MDKTKPHETLSDTPIAKSVVANMRRHKQGKVVDIKSVVDGYAMAEGLRKTVVSKKELAAFDPAHVAFACEIDRCQALFSEGRFCLLAAPAARVLFVCCLK